MIFTQETSSQIKHKKINKPRLVAPFSIAAMQSNTKVIPPPRLPIFRKRIKQQTLFRMYVNRGDMPIVQDYRKNGNRFSGLILMWLINPNELSYSHYLPIFFDGLAESEFPFSYMARSGIHDMLAFGGDKVLPVLPQLILPIKNALNTRNPDIIIATLSAIQHLLRMGQFIGFALVPYFNQLLPILNIMRNTAVDVNLYDKIDYKRKGNFADKIDETIELLEKHGGPDAFINIKYIMPTYESCVWN